MSEFSKDGSVLGRPVTRRQVLKGALTIGAVASLGPVIGACGGGDQAGETTPTEEAAKKGGHLRVGLVGGSTKDTADPQRAMLVPDDALNWLMFEGLMQYSPKLVPELLLAEEVSKNADATEWTVRLKPDIPWHDGRTVSADDVVFSFQRIVDPKEPLDGATALMGLKPEDIMKVDDMTVKFRWDTPNVLFGTDGLTQRLVHIVPVGFDAANPVGTGPFKLESFVAGDRFGLSAFKDYHGGAPNLSEISLIEFAEPTARWNALMSGTVDAIVELPPAQLTMIEAEDGYAPLDAKVGGFACFMMHTQKKPFDDVRVRQAIRLIPDRAQMLEQAYNGVGWIGNDMYSPFDAGYPSSLRQRDQDLEQAASLLKQAGYEGLTVELVTSDAIGNGAVAQAQVFAEQAKGAGVEVKVNKVESGVLWGDDYMSWAFAGDWFSYRNYLQMAAIASMPDAPYNSTHWKNARWQAIVEEAMRTADDDKRNEMVAEASTIEFEEGGIIIPSFKNQLDAYSIKVKGLVEGDRMGTPLGRWRLHQAYIG